MLILLLTSCFIFYSTLHPTIIKLHHILLLLTHTPYPYLLLPAHLHERINNKIELDSPKVATMDKINAGDKKVYCRCWLSGTFPLCDASHVAHNKETGDNVGPLIVSVEKEE